MRGKTRRVEGFGCNHVCLFYIFISFVPAFCGYCALFYVGKDFLYNWEAQNKFLCEQFTACFGFAATDLYRDGHDAVQLDRVGRLFALQGRLHPPPL